MNTAENTGPEITPYLGTFHAVEASLNTFFGFLNSIT